MIQLNEALALMQLPFMQRAILGGAMLGTTGGLLGSFTVLQELSFFGDALGHSAMLGVSLGLLLGLDPHFTILPFLLVLSFVVTVLLERTRLWTDALLNAIYSSSLALAIIILSFIDRYKGSINQYLFGDVLTVSSEHLIVTGGLLLVSALFLGLTLRSQMLLMISEPIAIVNGVPAKLYRHLFVTLLALVVAAAIQSVGVLLVSAFIVIPPCTARLWSDRFSHYVPLSVVLGTTTATLGVVCSALLDWPSGPTMVLVQFAVFVLALLLPKHRRFIA